MISSEVSYVFYYESTGNNAFQESFEIRAWFEVKRQDMAIVLFGS